MILNKELLKYIQLNKNSIPQYNEAFKVIGSNSRENYCGVGESYNEKLKNIYDKYNLNIIDIEYTLDLIELLQDTTIYFPLSHDGRGRIYPRAYPISTTSSNFVRSVIQAGEEYTFSKEDYPEEWEKFISTLAKRLNMTPVNLKKNSNRELEKLDGQVIKDFSLYSLINIYVRREKHKKTRALIGYDVTAYGLPIMALVCSSQKGLELTKVFKLEKEEGKEERLIESYNQNGKSYLFV